ncbi:glycoside hydrolase family 88 protein [Bacillus sp. IB182487]|uniref:Glycoside hydrolase family 88 protein n=1 Tax=Metabacillus arenae TaxID=2771434 RepID=A0A926NQN2_9BACI|nr:glycoside hydrolase family 88 protein [Metabacillus arenae]
MQTVSDEGLMNKERYATRPEVDRAFVEKACAYVLKKIDQNLDEFTNMFPDASSKNLVYPKTENVEWTPGFWTGMLWLAYEITKDEKYKQVAERHVESFKNRIEKKIHVDHHDLGFLYTLSSVSAYKLTKNETAKEAALGAAKHLSTRYYEKAGIIQAWGDLSDPKQRGRMIIDCNMNLPLLYWASEITGDQSYYDMAYQHVQKAAAHIVRKDASTFHTFYMDPEHGGPLYGNTHQGFSDDSCWARGQAWGIYGFPLSYSYTQDDEFITLSKKLANYFLNRLPEDHICYWDLIFTEGTEERDSSAAAISACGLLELSKSLPLTDSLKMYYDNAALSIVQSLSEYYTTAQEPEANGLLKHGVYYKAGNMGVDESCIWGDYFYFEALVRLLKDWKMYW